MSDDTPRDSAESAGDGAADQAEGRTSNREDGREPPYRIHAQYVKDFSLENPKAPECFMDPLVRQVRPQLEVDVTTRALGDRLVEVLLQANVTGRIEPDTERERTAYLIELSYGAAVEIGNVPKDAIDPLLRVEIPRLLFPYVRQIVSTATQDSGHNLLMLPTIDFLGLYRWKQREGQIDSATADQVADEQPRAESAGAPSTSQAS